MKRITKDIMKRIESGFYHSDYIEAMELIGMIDVEKWSRKDLDDLSIRLSASFMLCDHTEHKAIIKGGQRRLRRKKEEKEKHEAIKKIDQKCGVWEQENLF